MQPTLQMSQVPVSQVPIVLVIPQGVQMPMGQAAAPGHHYAGYHQYAPQAKQMPMQLQSLDFDLDKAKEKLKKSFEKKK